MRSQTKWGVFFISLSVLIALISNFHPIVLIYSLAVFVLGLALIIFRKREEILEEVG
jgi:hypothetical protein